MNLIPLESSTSIPYAYIGVHLPVKISCAPQLISEELFELRQSIPSEL